MKQDDLMKNLRHEVWKQSYTTVLGRHFKRYDTGDDQFSKIASVRIQDPQHLNNLFPQRQAGMPDYNYSIMMGLGSLDSSVADYSFTPYMLCKHGREIVADHEFVVTPNVEEFPVTSSPVPLIYLEWVRKNWLELDAEAVGGVFESKFEPKPTNSAVTIRTRKRLLGYHFRKDINETLWKFLNQARGQIKEIRFHLGIDKNKDVNDAYIFSPVFEIHTPALSTDHLAELHYKDVKTRLIGNTQILYFEYTSPCPSSCPDDPTV